MKDYVVELGLMDIRKLELQARKSPEKKVRFIIKIPDDIKIVAYDRIKGVKGQIEEPPIEINSNTQIPETTLE